MFVILDLLLNERGHFIFTVLNTLLNFVKLVAAIIIIGQFFNQFFVFFFQLINLLRR